MEKQTAQKILKKNKQDWEELAEKFSSTRQKPIWPELESLVKYIKDGDKVLDLGCGNGRLLAIFRDKKVEYVGLDASKKLIEIARQESLKSKFYSLGFNFIIGDALYLPFQDEDFNAIFAVAFLHHIPSRDLHLKVLKKCYSVLEPKGFLILTVWNLWQPRLLLKYRIWPMLFGWRRRGLDWKDVYIPFGLKEKTVLRYYHAFTRFELKRLVQKAGFKIIDSYYTTKGQRSNRLKGFNLIVVAKKI